VTCGYCRLNLSIERDRITSPRARPGEEAAEPAFEQPEATLSSRESPRFELSVLEQPIAGAPAQLWRGVDLSGDRFAFIELRLIDAERHPVAGELEALFEAARDSLQDDGDPGLAANLALEAMKGSAVRLEIGILLFDPRPMTLTAYQAGCGDATWWLSQEEGRALTLNRGRGALERKNLREARDHFSNDPPVRLATGDSVLWLSAGVLGRGDTTRYPIGVGPLLPVLNENLGEDPLRVVTLAKNAAWKAREASSWQRALRPIGDFSLAAIRAIPPVLVEAIPGAGQVELHRTGRFELAVRRTPGDAAAFHPLHGERAVLVWLAPRTGRLAGDALERASRAVLAVLDKPDHGDNENPRRAGREALAALGGDDLDLAVIQLFDPHAKVAFFTHGWRAPIELLDRAKRSSSRTFDQGGEAWLADGGRLFFPGALDAAGTVTALDGFAERWNGGKASRLYEAARAHWKTKSSERALEKLGRAAASDAKVSALPGLALVTVLEP